MAGAVPALTAQTISAEFYNRGLERQTAGNLDGAFGDCIKAIEIDPKSDDGYYFRGGVFFKKKAYDDALADYTKAIDLRPVYAPNYCLRAKVYRALKLEDLADADEKRAGDLEKTRPT